MFRRKKISQNSKQHLVFILITHRKKNPLFKKTLTLIMLKKKFTQLIQLKTTSLLTTEAHITSQLVLV